MNKHTKAQVAAIISVSRTHVLFLVVLFFAGSSAWAADAPSEADIWAAVGTTLPAYWTVQSIEIKASVITGDAVEPHYRQRFVANVVADEALFAPAPRDSMIEPFVVLIETSGAKRSQQLYGLATSTLVLGKWVVDLSMENSVEGLGQPRSMFSGPTVVAGTTGAEKATRRLIEANELIKTMTEGLLLAEANVQTLNQLVVAEQEVLEIEGKNTLKILRSTLQEQIDTLTAAAEQERSLLIEENRRGLHALMARFEEERAAATASAQTFQAIAEANAEISALEELSTIRKTLAQTRQTLVEQQREQISADIEIRLARYSELVRNLQSEDAALRSAAWDAILASDDTMLKAVAMREAMKSTDRGFRSTAQREAMNSGDPELQSIALAAWVAGLPRFSMSIMSSRDKNEKIAIMHFDIISLEENYVFTGRFGNLDWLHPYWTIEDAVNASGALNGRELSLRGKFGRREDGKYLVCTAILTLDSDARLKGNLACADQLYETIVNIWSQE